MSEAMSQVAFLFPGGGSQKVGMGADLTASCEDCRATLAAADRALGFALSKVMFEGPKEELDPSIISHPAVLAVSVMQARHLKSMGILPDAVVGHSLGQFSALVVADALNFETAVRLVAERARLMQEAVPAGTGGMMAIIGMEREEIYDACDRARSIGIVNVACHNSPSQMVISGERRAVEAAAQICEEAGGAAVMLPISVASHCDLLIPMKETFAKLIESIEIADPVIPVIDNVTAQPLTRAADVRQALIAQLTSPVLFEESLRYLASLPFRRFIECGPGKSMLDLAKRVVTKIELRSFEEAALFRVSVAG